MVAPSPAELALAVGVLEGRFVAPQHLVNGPTRHAASGEEGEDLVHTQAIIPASTIALGAPGLAREESVIARMVELRKPETARVVSNFFARVGGFVLEDIPARIRLFRSPARRVRRRAHGSVLLNRLRWPLPALDGPTKVLAVAAPYVLALAVAALLLERQQQAASTPIALEPTLAAASAPEPVPSDQATAILAGAVATEVVEPKTEAPPEAESSEFERELSSLAWAVRLSTLPRSRAKTAALVAPNTALEILRGVETKRGWVLARVPATSEVGYLPLAHLEAEPPATAKASRSERKKRRSRR